MHLPDINVWLALAFASHKHHGAATNWFEHLQSGEAAFCRFTQLGFLRLATTPKVLVEKPLTLVEAWHSYDELFRDPRVVFSEEPRLFGLAS
jgi:toxin-antitoxin system PIN domain toxin